MQTIFVTNVSAGAGRGGPIEPDEDGPPVPLYDFRPQRIPSRMTENAADDEAELSEGEGGLYWPSYRLEPSDPSAGAIEPPDADESFGLVSLDSESLRDLDELRGAWAPPVENEAPFVENTAGIEPPDGEPFGSPVYDFGPDSDRRRRRW